MSDVNVLCDVTNVCAFMFVSVSNIFFPLSDFENTDFSGTHLANLRVNYYVLPGRRLTLCDTVLDPGLEYMMLSMEHVGKLFVQHQNQPRICTDRLMNQIIESCRASGTQRNAVTKTNNEFIYEWIGLASFRFLFNDRTLYSRLPVEFHEFNFNEDIMRDLHHNQQVLHDWLRSENPENFQFVTADGVLERLRMKNTLMKYIQFTRTIERKARKGVVFDWHQKQEHTGAMWIHHFYLWQCFLSDFHYHQSPYWRGIIEFKNDNNKPNSHLKRHQRKLYWRTNAHVSNRGR